MYMKVKFINSKAIYSGNLFPPCFIEFPVEPDNNIWVMLGFVEYKHTKNLD